MFPAEGPMSAKVRGMSGLPTLAPGFTRRILPEGRGGAPGAPYDRPKSNQMGWGPCGAGGPFVTVICPAAKITNTFLSEGLAATGLWALMPPSCGHTGWGLTLREGMERGQGGQQAACHPRHAPKAALEAEPTPNPPTPVHLQPPLLGALWSWGAEPREHPQLCPGHPSTCLLPQALAS